MAFAAHDRLGARADHIVDTFTAATTPTLATLRGQPITGAWRLMISNHEAQRSGQAQALEADAETVTVHRVAAPDGQRSHRLPIGSRWASATTMTSTGV